MLAEAQIQALQNFLGQYSREQLVWVNGYLSGLLNEKAIPATPSAPQKITIAYGTETGNAQKLAVNFAAKAKKQGIRTKVVGLDQYPLTELANEEYFFTIISTHGEGEPPIAAKKFYDHIHQNGFKIPKLQYSVLALGDTSYPLFCQTGEDVDKQLQQLGGNRLAPMQKCDVDFEADADKWINEVLVKVSKTVSPAIASPAIAAPAAKKPAGKKIYEGRVAANFNLTANGSTKKTYHISLQAEGVDYLPGDSIAIVPHNDALTVAAVLQALQADGTAMMQWKNETYSLQQLLTEKFSIVYLLEKTVQQYAALAGTTITVGRYNLLQLLQQYPLPVTVTAEQVTGILTAIAPRIYNIASSPAAHDNTIDIIALQDVFTINGQQQKGLCTAYFENCTPGSTISFFIQPNKRFRLPAADKDIIMIGPGTGIAPFRSFVAERDAMGATGRNWLFFGETDFTTDFYYQTEWQQWFSTDVLTKVSLVFDNSAAPDFTLSTKIIEQGAELFEWLQQGASLYLCGQKDPMSREVEAALQQVLANQLPAVEAAAYWEELKSGGRYMKDVY